jgi:hypothetical protein
MAGIRSPRKSAPGSDAMKAWLADLLAGPDSKADEMAVIALLIGLCFVLSLLTLIALTVFTVAVRGDLWEPEHFANAAAILFGAAGGVVGAMCCAMGLKSKLGG